MNLTPLLKHRLFRPVLGGTLTVLCGWFLWASKPGEAWENASYDYLYRFGARTFTNRVNLILMDKEACKHYEVTNVENWDRKLHTKLLNELTTNGCPLVVFDVLFSSARDPAGDEEFAAAMKRHGNVVIAADTDRLSFERSEIGVTDKPLTNFGASAQVGIAKAGVEKCQFVRRPWPVTIPRDSRDHQSLPWTVAFLVNNKLKEGQHYDWLRYYKGWETATASYHLAIENPSYYSNKIVFIGNYPMDLDPRVLLDDKFCTPFTRWTNEAVGGMEIMATEFLNILNGDWLRRLPGWLEMLLLLLTGTALGAGFCFARPLPGFFLGLAIFVLVMLAAVCWSYYTNYWFPWLVISGGQVPCAWVWAVAASKRAPVPASQSTIDTIETVPEPQLTTASGESFPDAPDYKFVGAAFGKGGFGKVWLVQNAIGQWQALKAIYKSNFKETSRAYETEFLGVKRYMPISDKHPGLLRVHFVSLKKEEGYFYYVMELGDAINSGWEQNPSSYKPRDVRLMLERAEKNRLPLRECVRIALALTEALDFLHGKGLTHRDIKPSNILFVNDQPRLADVGLVSEILPTIEQSTAPGTIGYMPPPPERTGTPQADIYALGMVLYVMRTGRTPEAFPEVSSTLIESKERIDFKRLNSIMLKACHPDKTLRYATASEMRAALLQIWNQIECPEPVPPAKQ